MRREQGSTILISNVCYGAGAGIPLYLDILRPHPQPEERMPVIVEIHGGGWRHGEKQAERNRIFAERGFFTVSIDYRLTDVAPFPAQIEDVRAAIRWLHASADDYHIDDERIGVWGHSAGGHLAALLGTSGDRETPDGKAHYHSCSARVRAVAPISPPVDVCLIATEAEDRLVGGSVLAATEIVRYANPAAYATADAPPFLIIHGTDDTVVRFEHATLLHDALKGVNADVTLRPVEGAGHMIPESVYQPLLLDFFQTHLRD
jgi:acetyl esterase/lipase